MSTIKLSEIVGQFLNSKDTSTHEYRRLLNIAIFGMKTEFNLDITGTYKTVILDVNANKTVSLPCDYITYSKIGVLNSRGEVATFSRNNQLSNYHSSYINDNSSRTVTNPLLNTTSVFPYPNSPNFYHYYNYFYNGDSFQLFGLDSGTPNIGEYKLDEKNKLILLNPQNIYTKIVLEYLSDGSDEDGCDYTLDVRVVAAMMAYLRWQNAIDLVKKFSQSTVRDLKREYYRNKRIAKMRNNKFNLSEMQKASRVGAKLVPKS